MTHHCPDLGSASDWLCHVGNLIQPIRSTTQIWAATRHQYGISALVSQTSFGLKTSGSFAKCRLFSEATKSVSIYPRSASVAWQPKVFLWRKVGLSYKGDPIIRKE